MLLDNLKMSEAFVKTSAKLARTALAAKLFDDSRERERNTSKYASLSTGSVPEKLKKPHKSIRSSRCTFVTCVTWARRKAVGSRISMNSPGLYLDTTPFTCTM